MKSVLLIFILLCLSMLNIRCLLMSLVYFYYVFFVLFWFITLWLRHVIVRPFFIFDYMNSLSHLCVAMFPASLLDHDLHWSGLYCASILLMAILLQAMFIIVFEAPIHNNVYCASSRVEYFVVLIVCFVHFRILNLSIVTLILIRPFSLRKECQCSSA